MREKESNFGQLKQDKMNNCELILELKERVAKLEREIAELKAGDPTQAMNQKAAAKYLGITPPTLRRYTRMDIVRAIPGTTRYRIAELDRYKAKRQRTQ